MLHVFQMLTSSKQYCESVPHWLTNALKAYTTPAHFNTGVQGFVKLTKRSADQHLRIKSFWGTTMNAVKVQIYCAIIACSLVAIVGNKLKVDRSIYEILQILSISLLDKTPIKEILTKCDFKNVKELNYKQLTISGF